ncbi:UDP-N-acetylglucosamine 2-epimerase (non-hydrolysing) [Butyrivibrio fibrisolvens DSM 3071]|uniref:UDP-N-acetylglucosamine 2-epimerase (Non-hydrolysing) n=1 Tax=Butyrivibrio fibrisolvens DSM 3071 TaxID=1121131 RepID=A0A1M5YYA2_BUTFI|nr:UDP-N-acetylglucosamine 2-epimerase (non-hydrolyzing) [Butyrivibrio fibrisolvens]SHI16955.1 UDP-N-acetylglucosamine 2-epimerase (non-hydrolysing) [Butyrivibrio fibrisolvens DSM 3071]
MEKIATIVGARPQFIKTAVISPKLRNHYQEVLIHTGQHYDYNMSEQFFEELNIPFPDYNLGISGGTHAEMTGRMLIEIEKVLINEKPDGVLVYGDTNSTLAAALAAAKLHIPICHIEAGVRTHSITNPEEINRICTDHVSTLLLACTDAGVKELEKEGLSDKTFLVGDPMYDVYVKYSGNMNVGDVYLTQLGSSDKIEVPEKYFYITCHREENTSDKSITEIFKAMESMGEKTIFPVHPRNRERVLRIINDYGFKDIVVVEPVGYLESMALVRNCIKVVTDSGGLQREAFFAKKQCVTVLNFVCWPETMIGNMNQLARPDAEDIIDKLSKDMVIDSNYQPFGDGNAANKIIMALQSGF